MAQAPQRRRSSQKRGLEASPPLLQLPATMQRSLLLLAAALVVQGPSAASARKLQVTTDDRDSQSFPWDLPEGLSQSPDLPLDEEPLVSLDSPRSGPQRARRHAATPALRMLIVFKRPWVMRRRGHPPVATRRRPLLAPPSRTHSLMCVGLMLLRLCRPAR